MRSTTSLSRASFELDASCLIVSLVTDVPVPSEPAGCLIFTIVDGGGCGCAASARRAVMRHWLIPCKQNEHS